MSPALEVLERARQHGVAIQAMGDRLKLQAARKPPDALVAEIQARKAELLSLLSSPALGASGSGAPSEWCNGLARLYTMPAPANVGERCWHQLIADCRRFCAEGWARQAAELGWGALDLFGCHQEAPRARYDHQGLLWLTGGRRLVALTTDTAVIETATGARLTYKRKPLAGGGQIPAWELSS